ESLIRDGIAAGEFPAQNPAASAACLMGAVSEGLIGPLAPEAGSLPDTRAPGDAITALCLQAVSAPPFRASLRLLEDTARRGPHPAWEALVGRPPRGARPPRHPGRAGGAGDARSPHLPRCRTVRGRARAAIPPPAALRRSCRPARRAGLAARLRAERRARPAGA